MAFVSEDQINLYKGFVKEMRESLGRNVVLHLPGPKTRCFNCLMDPVNRKSTGMYSPTFPLPDGQTHKPFVGGVCPVCNGTGQYTTETTKIVKALIRWLKVDQKRYIIQGLEAENDFRIKADIKYYSDFKKARKVVIDGIPAEVTSIVKGGMRDLIQIKVFLKRSEFNSASNKTDVSGY
jgi:hypothetical protein